MFRLDNIYNRWSFERAMRHIAYWVFWLFLYATINSFVHEDYTLIKSILLEIKIMTIKVPFTYFVVYFLVPNFLIKKKYFAFFSLAAIPVFLGGVGIYALYSFCVNDYDIIQNPMLVLNPHLFYKSLDLAYISTFPVIYKLHQFYLQQEKTNQQINEQKLRAELELLKHQLHPHFLFNTLNNLYAMVLTQDKKAGDVLLHLSNIMSYMLYECNLPFIELDKEVKQLKNYIELEKIRYGNRLNVSFELVGDISKIQIAPLLLIGFIENAFKHGVGNNIEKSWIRINIWLEGNSLDFIVENNINLQNEAKDYPIENKGGIGLVNIKKRLDLLYPNKYNLLFDQKDTFWVRLKLVL